MSSGGARSPVPAVAIASAAALSAAKIGPTPAADLTAASRPRGGTG